MATKESRSMFEGADDRVTDTSKAWYPNAGQARDGYSKEGAATATCYCGAVQVEFPTEAPGLVTSFVCNCPDCRKITASMFASNFTVLDSHMKHLRGKENLSKWGQENTVATQHRMDNYFCKTCGTLLYRVSSRFPGMSIMRLGTIDDFNLVETKLRPRIEQYTGVRASWLSEVKGAEHHVAGGI